MTHTAEWKAAENGMGRVLGAGPYSHAIFSLDEADYRPVTVHGETAKVARERAKLIVKAVNSHQALVDALETLVTYAEVSGQPAHDSQGRVIARIPASAYQMITEALALAKGEL